MTDRPVTLVNGASPVVIQVRPLPILVTQVPGVGPQGPEGGHDLLDAHLADDTPHPPYDDMPDLTLLFNNALI